MNKLQNVLNKQPATEHNHKEQSVLHTLWQRIEKHQARNHKFEREVSDLFDNFKGQALAAEHQLIESVIVQCEHLATFLPKKSLTQTERNVLLDWIESEVHFLQSHPFAQPNQVEALMSFIDVQQSLHEKNCHDKISPQDIAGLRALLEDEFDGMLKLSDEQITELLVDPSKFAEHVDQLRATLGESSHDQGLDEEYEQDHENWDDELDDTFFDEFYKRFGDSQDQQSSVKADKLEKLFKGSKLNKMYKRLASKLHPDKALNEAERAQKHEQMQELAEARRQQDGFSILKLYLTHFDDDPGLDADTLASLQPLLEEKVKILNVEYQELKNRNDAKTLVWRRFKRNSKKKTLDAIAQHVVELHAQVNKLRQFKDEFKTLKSLKAELKVKNLENQELAMQQMQAFFGSDFFSLDDDEFF